MLEAGELHVNSRKIDEDQREKIVKDAIMHILIISQDVFFFRCKIVPVDVSRLDSRTTRANTKRKRQTNEWL